jgi:hypothetical protein
MNPTDLPEPTKQPDNPDTDEQTLPIDPEQTESQDEVDEASDESFPASDPPSYSRSSTTKD